MSITPLFDSLLHPSQIEDSVKLDAEIRDMIAQMKEQSFIGGNIVNLRPISDLQEAKQFVDLCRESSNGFLEPIILTDVPGVNINSEDFVAGVSKFGVKAIKIHPRISEIEYDSPHICNLMKSAGMAKIVVYLCTYQHRAAPNISNRDPLFLLCDLLNKTHKTKTVLLHGGDVRLLEYAELVRANKQLLLDLSFTLLKYRNSSLDQDLRFLFTYFDQRISIGSDFPDFDFASVRERFEDLSVGLSEDKKARIGHKNLLTFLDMNLRV